MILGLSSFTYGWAVGVPGNPPREPLDERELIARTLAASLRCLQIGDNLPLHAFSPDRLIALRKKANAHNVRLEAGARSLTASHLQRYIEIAAFLDSPLLRFVVDSDNYEPHPREVVAILKDSLPELRRTGITLGLENHDRFKARDLAAIIEAVGDSHVGICLDCVNSIGAGEGFEHVAEILSPYTVNVHLKDYSITRLSHKMGFIVRGTPLGKGMLNVEDLMEKLSASPCQSAILEQWVVPDSTLDQTIAKEYLWASEGLQHLSQYHYFKTTANHY